MITPEMVNAAAREMYEMTQAAQRIHFDLLPEVAQLEMMKLATAALLAAEPLRPKPES